MTNKFGLLITALMVLWGLNGCASQRGNPQTPSSGPQIVTRPPATSAPSAEAPYTIPPGYVKTYVVFGQRYFILGSSQGYRETGIASWYGAKFNGRPTASGEIYNMHELTAAHKSLPLPTVARVTNLNNQRSIIVKINDRGPFVGDRIIDLSMASAQALDMIGPGTARVEVVALNPSNATVYEAPNSAQGASPPQQAQESAPAGYSPSPANNSASSFVQVGAFSDVSNANQLRNQLEQSGFENVIIQNILVDNRALHRVRIGPLLKSGANSVLEQLINMGLNNARITSK